MSYLNYNKYYFIGIGGIGMSAVAEYIHSIGKNVSGYDRDNSLITKRLIKLGIDTVSYTHLTLPTISRV